MPRKKAVKSVPKAKAPPPAPPQREWTRPRLTSREQEALVTLKEIEHWHIDRGERDDPHVAALTALIRKFQ